MATLNHIGNLNVSQLPGPLYLKIKTHLNAEHSWRAFTTTLDGVYTLSEETIETFNRDQHRVEKLILWLRSLEMTIKQFVEYARQAQIYPILEMFDFRAPVAITHQPFPSWCSITEGESLSIELRANGYPRPQYQWLKDNHPIPNANGNVLQIPSAITGHSGVYKCLVRNGQSVDCMLYSNPVEVAVSLPKPLVIKEHPRSYTVSLNSNVLLTCEVWGDVEVDYQWMRSGKEITDGQNVSGSNTNELKIKNIQNTDWTGCYCCRISRGEDVIFTQDAVLQVDSKSKPPKKYTATDKVALLMGAGDYRSEPKLIAPEHDIDTMAKVFRSLNFQVVSLLNLTKKEMIAAINEFKYLVGEGVYCVFYFCGHGFEASGQCYLLPPDAPQGYMYSDCVSAEAILFNVLLPRKPRICCMILDICRLKREGKPELLKPPEGEYVLCYGTSQGYASYEQNKSGILVSHLKDILQSDMGVEEAFVLLRQEIKKDPVLKEVNADEKFIIQAPEIRTILSEMDRSFHDKVDSKGHTEACEARKTVWERAHWTPGPRSREVDFPGFTITVRLDFKAEFSNMLTIFCSVIDAGQSKICRAHISAIPADVAEKVNIESLQEGTETSLCKTFLALQNIQRLKNEMHIQITVACILHDNTKVNRSVVENLGLPLVSRLCLWKDCPNLLTRCQEPQEDDVDVSPYNSYSTQV